MPSYKNGDLPFPFVECGRFCEGVGVEGDDGEYGSEDEGEEKF